MIALSDEDLQTAIGEGDFSPEIRSSHERVAVVLTQSWCPQWLMMRLWLKGMDEDLHIYWAEYEKMESYHSFMHFKETVFGNPLVPYIRFYNGGELVGESNYCNRERFLDLIGL
jgi:hypothetical protein